MEVPTICKAYVRGYTPKIPIELIDKLRTQITTALF